jgi:hypothetical protein
VAPLKMQTIVIDSNQNFVEKNIQLFEKINQLGKDFERFVARKVNFTKLTHLIPGLNQGILTEG